MGIVSAIIVAAGSGSRMGAPVPKQFIEINGKTILEHSIDKFVQSDMFDEITIVLSTDYIEKGKEISANYPKQKIILCEGGQERFHSVKNALDLIDINCDIVFIHDAVRPFCSLDLINLSYKECKKHSNAIPAVPLKDSIRAIEQNGQSKIVDRSNLRSIQTPQVFKFSVIQDAYQVEFSDTFTDDASVYEAAGKKIHLVKGESFNIKITTPDDLEFARLWL